MARIKIEDLPILEDLSAKEIKGIFGGALKLTGDTGSYDPMSSVMDADSFRTDKDSLVFTVWD